MANVLLCPICKKLCDLKMVDGGEWKHVCAYCGFTRPFLQEIKTWPIKKAATKNPQVEIEKVFLGGDRKQRFKLFLKQNGLCAYCGVTMNAALLNPPAPNSLTLDHVISREHGGDNSEENLVAACHMCNSKKGQLESSTPTFRRDYSWPIPDGLDIKINFLACV